LPGAPRVHSVRSCQKADRGFNDAGRERRFSVLNVALTEEAGMIAIRTGGRC
jgi:hypothetical protein